MKVIFIAALHNLNLESVEYNGTQVFSGAKIVDGKDSIINIDSFKDTLGSHSINEIKDNMCMYITRDFENIKSQDDMEQIGVNSVCYYLELTDNFVEDLWKVKDNNVYARDGFVICCDDDYIKFITYKVSLGAMFSYADVKEGPTYFSKSEINIAKENYNDTFISEGNLGHNEIDYRRIMEEDHTKETENIFHSKKNKDRFIIANQFIHNARDSNLLPMKIVHYSAALESLLMNEGSGIAHKIAERVALLLGDTDEDRISKFKFIKDAYSIRSSIIHGSSLKNSETDDKLKRISKGLDSILRILTTSKVDILSKNNVDLENYFQNLLLTRNGN